MRLRILRGSPYPDPGMTGVPEPDSQGNVIESPYFSPLPVFKAKRSASFGCSLVGHAAVVAVVFWLGPGVEPATKPLIQQYSVRYLQLQTPPPPPLVVAGGSSASPEPGPRSPAPNRAAEAPLAGMGSGAPAPKAAKAAPRKFELPAMPQRQWVEQTLVQLELPPDLATKSAMRLPAVVIWDSKTRLPRPPNRRFIAPARKEVARAPQSILAEPKLEVPNQEPKIADINFAAPRITDIPPALPLPPSSTTPIRIVSAAPSGVIPQSSGTDSAQRDAANIISIPDMPIPGGAMLALPPANQVATAHMAGGSEQGTGSDASSGKVGAGQGTQAGSGKGSAPGPGDGALPGGNAGGAGGGGAGAAGSGAAGSGGRGAGQGLLAGAGTGSGTGAAGRGTGTGTGPGAGDGSGTTAARPVARIVRPNDGHFPAVVLGSSAAGAYPEAVGALGGRLVYTVYLRVGTKKNWIMQYCLPRSAEQGVKVKGAATPVEPPYPFLMLCPDLELTPEMDYVIVHGMVNAAGKFEQLSMVGVSGFPSEKLLLSSLGMWQFRPASRDGQPTMVEILLIIPREEV